MNLFRMLFSHNHDFYALLQQQAETVHEGIRIFCNCTEGGDSYASAVFRAEEHADEQRLLVTTALGQAFSTPFDREDIEDLSHLFDDIMDLARRAASEMAALDMGPDEHLAAMFAVVGAGVDHLVEGCAGLQHRHSHAREAITAAKGTEWKMQMAYEKAITALFATDDMKNIMKRREVYRLVQDVAVSVAHAAEFMQRLLVKLV